MFIQCVYVYVGFYSKGTLCVELLFVFLYMSKYNNNIIMIIIIKFNLKNIVYIYSYMYFTVEYYLLFKQQHTFHSNFRQRTNHSQPKTPFLSQIQITPTTQSNPHHIIHNSRN